MRVNFLKWKLSQPNTYDMKYKIFVVFIHVMVHPNSWTKFVQEVVTNYLAHSCNIRDPFK